MPDTHARGAALPEWIYGALREALLQYGVTSVEEIRRLTPREVRAYFCGGLDLMLIDLKREIGPPEPVVHVAV